MASKSASTERSKSKINYAVYCVNMFGSGLKTIKDEFKRQVATGVRQTVFVLDLEDLQTEPTRLTNRKDHFRENSHTNLMPLVLNHIQGFLRHYEKLTQKITRELKFDLYEYWLKQSGATDNNKPEKTVMSTKETGATKRTETWANKLIVKDHNRLGQSEWLSSKKYIRDEPIEGKLYIIILGQMNESFVTDLLRRDQPVEAIINFLPTESNYDIMLGNKKLRNFISSTLETINNSIFNIRQEAVLKSVGLFTHRLPVISNCLATKNGRQIFDQLTWCIYDIDVLKRQYESFYFKPFQITNVEMPPNENITLLYHVAESLNICGRYQKSSLPSSEADLASIAVYLNSLLNACDQLADVKTERNETSFPNAFSTITNISKFDRLVVAENNNLLINMLRYVESDDFKEIYLCCLDYRELGKFAISQEGEVLRKTAKTGSSLASQLPQYVKYFVNKECSWQRITQLKREYDEYEILKPSGGYKLYIFKRNYYVVKEHEHSAVIPTRLCFRDFTLFQMEEFLTDLKIPKLDSDADGNKTPDQAELESDIFIRPNSLKALMLQKKLNEEIPKRKNESRHKRKSGRESSFSTNTRTSEVHHGLPSGHHLLQGYNLSDTLQEVSSKTSTYSFHNGAIRLYEEKWCFREMNKQLSVAVDNVTVFFSAISQQQKGISNSVRFVTEDNISIRILNDESECSRVVMIYPNGLSIYQHMDYCEQIWHCDKPPRDEQKRILTKYGAIIVYFRSQDVKIMRYNGEVYRLYQHELEEEANQDIKNKTPKLAEYNFQKQKRTLSSQTTRSRSSKNLSSDESIKISSSSKPSTSNLVFSLKFELNFLELLCATYGLSYLRFSITTSQGKLINVASDGELYESHQCSVNEWFDYSANEAYCSRSDGVKMVWGQNAFKCFHKDGTVFNVTTEEGFPVTDEDEFESLLTQSSSHKEFPEETDESYRQVAFETQSSNSGLTNGINEEVCKTFDDQFVQLKCQNLFVIHPNYAKVLMQGLATTSPNMELFGINSIRISSQHDDSNEDNLNIYEAFKEDKANAKLVVNVWIHNQLNVKLEDTSCQDNVIITSKIGAKSDSLRLSLKYTDNINDVFKCWVKELDAFKGDNEGELREVFFMEKTNCDSSIRGFEFLSPLPSSSAYKYQMSNNVIELNDIATINEKMLYSSEEHENDLKKFPRFKEVQKGKNGLSPEKEPSLSVSANVILEVPHQLRNLSNITKFIEPFENMDFNSLRGKFKNALDYYLRPQRHRCIKMLCSQISWKKRIWEHHRRLLNEKQRRGLYIAMIKHETYPNYWQFAHAYGNDGNREVPVQKCLLAGLRDWYYNERNFFLKRFYLYLAPKHKCALFELGQPNKLMKRRQINA